MPFYDTPATVTGTLSQIAQEQRRSAANRRLESAVIGSGGIQILDENEELAATIGALPGGGTGIAVVGADGYTSFDQLAFGRKYARNDAEVTFGGPGTGATYPRGSWQYVGPNLTGLRVTGGRLTVTVGCNIVLALGPGGAFVGARLVGPSTRNPELGTSLSLDRRGEGMVNQMGASREIVFEGLADGEYDVQMAYQNTAVGSPGAILTASYRTISATLT